MIGFSDIQADLAQQLVAENLQVLIFNQRTLQEILDTIAVLGRIVGAEDARARWSTATSRACPRRKRAPRNARASRACTSRSGTTR